MSNSSVTYTPKSDTEVHNLARMNLGLEGIVVLVGQFTHGTIKEQQKPGNLPRV